MRLNLNITIAGLALLATAGLPLRSESTPASVSGLSRPQAIEAARRLTHLLDYVGRDYAGAVAGGKVIHAEEYAEQVEMVGHIEKLAASLPQLSGDGDFLDDLRELRTAVEEKADPARIAELCSRLRVHLIDSLALSTYPVRAPDLAIGKTYYLANCVACHGAEGRGDGPSAAKLTPRPSDLTSARLAALSPYQIANTIRFGVPGTGMAAHLQENEQQIWDAAFYVASLSHPEHGGTSAPASSPFTLQELASNADADLLQRHDRATPAQLNWARNHPPPPSDDLSDFGVARALLDQSLARYANGDREGARRDALDSYLEGVEPLEARLRTRHPSYVTEVEGRLARLRTLMAQSAPGPAVASEGENARLFLERGDELLADKELSPFWLLLSAAAILLREGLEAVLIVVMLLGLAAGTGARRVRVATHAGWIGALVLGLVTWGVSRWLLKFSGAGRETVEGLTSLLAVAVLLYVGFWLHSKSEIGRWHAFLKQATGAGGIGFWGAFGASFLAVYREAFETVLFFQTLWLDGGERSHLWIVIGMAVGSLAVGVIAWLLLVLEKKLPLRQFFTLSAITMLILAVILAGKGLHSLQESGWIPQTVFAFRIPSMFRSFLDFFGFFPSVQTLVLQGVTATTALLLWLWSGKSATAKQPEGVS